MGFDILQFFHDTQRENFNVEISYEEIEMHGVPLGSGGNAHVWEGIWKKPGSEPKQVAIKEVTANEYASVADICKEVQMMAGLWVCPVFGYCILDDEVVWIVLGRADSDLEKQLASSPLKHSLLDILQMFIQITKPVAYLHTFANVIHRDIKPQNFLLINNEIVLSDFGLSKDLSVSVVGNSDSTMNYSAPEILQENKNWTQKADIYSLGMTFNHALSGKTPFASLVDGDIAGMVLKGERPEIPPDIDEGIASIIRKCWDANPENRPTAKEILEMLTRLVDPGQYKVLWTIQEAALFGLTPIVETFANKQNTRLIKDNPIFYAVAGGHAETVYRLLDLGVDINLPDLVRSTVLANNLSLLQLLLDRGAVADGKSMSGPATPLYLAATKGLVPIFHELLKHGADVNKLANEGRSALLAASLFGHAEIVTTLLANGAKVNHQDNAKNTALILAAKGPTAIVQDLIAHGADVNTVGNNGDNALFRAAHSGSAETVEYLLSCRAEDKPNNNGLTPLCSAVINKRVQVVQALINGGVNVNKPLNVDGSTPLMMAAHYGNMEIFLELLNNNATVNATNHAGRTPLHFAVSSSQIEIAKTLIKRGADVNILAKEGWTPLMIAADDGNLEILQELLDANAEVDKADNDGNNALHRAAQEGRLSTVQALIKAGADANKPTKDGKTPLMMAALKSLEVVQELLSHNVDIDQVDDSGFTPLFSAVVGKNVPIVQALVKAGADANKCSSKSSISPLGMAIHLGDTGIIQELLTNNTEMDPSLISYAIGKGDVAVVETLIRCGVDITKESDGSPTPEPTKKESTGCIIQ